MVNRVSSYFLKGGHPAIETEPKNNMNTHKAKRHRNSDTKTGNREPQQYRIGTVSNELLGGGGGGLKLVLRAQPNPQFLNWYI